MLRLCGFNLLVALDPYDDSDLWQAGQLLKRTPEQRFDQLVSFARFARDARAASGAPRG